MSPAWRSHHTSLRYQIPCYTNSENELVLCFGEAVKEANSVFNCSETMFKKFQEHIKERTTAQLTLRARTKIFSTPKLESVQAVQEKNNKFKFVFNSESKEEKEKPDHSYKTVQTRNKFFM